MQNVQEISHVVNTINFKTLPSVFDVLFHINLHVGEYKTSARAEDFHGWLKCDGRSLSRTEYADLFEIVGTSFGSSTSNTFKLPDMRGRVMGCVGQGQYLTNRSLGAIVGAETHLLTRDELPNHDHTATAANNGSHNHTGATGSNGSHTHTVNDPGHSHIQTTVNDDFNGSGGAGPSFTTDSAGVRTWTNINSNTTGITLDSVGDHTHSIATDGSHTHTITVSSVGSNVPHNNMQPTAFIGNMFIFAGYKPRPVIVG